MHVEHQVIAARTGIFFGWPANNGLWSWDGGREILVGCVAGSYDPSTEFHFIRPPYTHHLLRSLDGGDTWQVETPSPYVGVGQNCSPLTRPLDFTHPGFALRVAGDGYHGSADPQGSFYYSYDRGSTWQGPYCFKGLNSVAELSGLILTPRTDSLIEGSQACLLMLSARPDHAFTDRVFCVRTQDGGQTFQWVGWLVPPSDPYRAVMPATVSWAEKHLVSAIRRRAVPEDCCWIDAYRSENGGLTWEPLGKVGDTGAGNGNPPALLRLANGRLCCVYGRRDIRQMVARYSRDDGLSWGEEIVLRDDFYGDRSDFGYPRLVQRADGQLMAFYYWATRDLPEQHIAASVW
jgi:hypothetical protein